MHNNAMKNRGTTLTSVFLVLFTLCMVAGAYIKIPVGPVPIALTSLFVLLAGLLLGPRLGLLSVLFYLLLGAIGLPVFTAGGGLGLFWGPTGGYLLGYPAAALITGMTAGKRRGKAYREIAALTAGTLVIYVTGVPWLAVTLHLSFNKALLAGLLPFLAGDIMKIAAAYGIVSLLKRTSPELFPYLRKE